MKLVLINNKNISIYLIFCLIFISFTKLRLFNLPIGFGEIGLILLGFIIIKSLVASNTKIVFKSFSENIFIKLWLALFILLITSYMWNNDKHFSSISSILHDFLAYGFVLYSILLFIILKDYININFEKLMQNLMYCVVLFYLVLLIYNIMIFDKTYIFLYGSWFKIDRFEGFSNGPNQIALLFTIIPFILFSFYKKYTIFLLLSSLIIGVLIGSNSLYLAWFVSFIIIIINKYFPYLNKLKCISLLVVLFIILLLNYNNIIEIIPSSQISLLHRVELISNAFELIQLSPLIGFGPGAHLSSNHNLDIYWEAHNTFLDITLQTGFFGLCIYLFLLYKIANKLIINKDIYLITAFISLIIFSTFHFLFRQPIFWFYLFYFYQIGNNRYIEN